MLPSRYWRHFAMVLLATTCAGSAVSPAAEIHVPSEEPTIQAGLTAASDGDTVIVADGIWTGAGNRDLVFNGKEVTVRSANGPGNCTIDAGGSETESHRAFVFAAGEGPLSVVDGFTLTGGYADRGGAIYCHGTSPTIENCLITGNIAEIRGGGISCHHAAEPEITGCIISNNSVLGDGNNPGGGGVSLIHQCFVRMENCRVEENSGWDYGGGIAIRSACDLMLDNCVITGNQAYSGGGLAGLNYSNTNMTNCLITGNQAQRGGGIYLFSDVGASPIPRYASLTIMRFCTVADNTASSWGGAISAHDWYGADAIDLKNTIVWGCGANPIRSSDDLTEIEWSDIEGGYIGEGNIDADPLFVAGSDGDYYLSHTAAGQAEDSPCVDSGDPESDLPEGTTRTDSIPDLGIPDIGYHYPFSDGCFMAADPVEFSVAARFDGEPPLDQLLDIWMCGTGSMDWSVSVDADWLELSPGAGTSTGEKDQVTICIDTAGLQYGVYQATITIEAPAAVNNLLEVPFTLRLFSPALAVAPGNGYSNPPLIRIYPPELASTHIDEFSAYGTAHHGAVVAAGDVDGDGFSEILTGPGPGPNCGPHVRGFGPHGVPVPGLSFFAYGTLGYGVNVTAGDIDGDGFDEIITGAGPGAVFGPHVRGWNFDGNGMVNTMGDVSFFAYGTPKWGVNVSAGDIDGDGIDEIITGAGPGTVYGPHVRGWNVDGGTATAMTGVSFLAYGTKKYGVNVSCGDVDGDGIDEIITGPGPGAVFGTHVRGWNYDGLAITPLPGLSFFAWPQEEARYGAKVFAGADLNGDGKDELVVGCGPDPDLGTPVKVYQYNGTQVTDWFALHAFMDLGLTYGTNVAAGEF